MSRRVLRGGSWGSEPGFLRSAGRGWSYPDSRVNSLGFRVVYSLPETEEKCRVVRGGSWNSLPGDCRSAYRVRSGFSDRFRVVGFRVVHKPEGSEK